jgi:hypothetical protein
MTIRCEKAKELIERFHDRELRGEEHDSVSKHLEQCENCSHELEKLDRMSSALKAHYEKLEASQDFSGLWNRVSEAIEEDEARPKALRERLSKIFTLPKRVAALAAAMATAIVLIFFYLSGGPKPALAANDCIIDSVDAENCSVMVYETGSTKMKIIWVMEEPKEETGASGQEAAPQEGVPS